MPRHVVAFVGQNANRILACQSERFLRLLQRNDLQCHVIDLNDPNFRERLAELLVDGVAFAWGYAGIGARLHTVDGHNLWEALKTPFVSVLADPPFLMPLNHRVKSRYVANAYIYNDWLAMQRQFFQAQQVSSLIPHGVLPNPGRHATPWAQRSHRMVLVKSGSDPAAQRALWSRWPKLTQTVLHDSAAVLCATGTCAILPTALACLQAHGIVLDYRPDLLFGLLQELDSYVRAYRADTMVRALLSLPVEIVGSGWDHLAATGSRARFLPAIDAGGLEALYADTQYLLNANPNISEGLHERVIRGFAAGCCVVSDENAFSRTALRAVPSYTGVEWHDRGLADQFAAVFHDAADKSGILAAGDAYVATHHDPALFLGQLAHLADLLRSSDWMAPYGLEAA